MHDPPIHTFSTTTPQTHVPVLLVLVFFLFFSASASSAVCFHSYSFCFHFLLLRSLQHTGTQQERNETPRSDVNGDRLSTIPCRDLEPISLRIKRKRALQNNLSSISSSSSSSSSSQIVAAHRHSTRKEQDT
jgi:hypothetical protein